MKTVIKNFFKEKERELVAKVLLFMLVPFIVIGCGGSEAGGTAADTNNPQVNSAPTISTIFADIELLENSGTANYELNISDADGDALTLSVESNDTSIITVTQNWNNSLLLADYQNQTLDFNLTTVADAFGTVRITINLSDGGENNATANFDVNVTEVEFQSGDTWKGLTYNTVVSPYTEKVWLDRNLGASQVCTSSTDTACYGDYYEWGRLTDGHEKNTSTVTATQATDISNAGAEFIGDSTMGDWASVGADDIGSLRGEQWSKTDGTSVCPVGFRVPSISELLAETTTLTSTDGGINNFLKLPKSGQRTFNNLSVGNQIQLWSSTHLDTASVSSSSLDVSDLPPAGSADMSTWRTYGLAVRCLKH